MNTATTTSCLLASLALAVLPSAAHGAEKHRQAPAGAAFYQPPAPLPGAHHGDLIWSRSAPGKNLVKKAHQTKLVLYRSVSPNGNPVAVSGTVTIPKGHAPKRGWPVLTWAHGTTGIADRCAPSRIGAMGSYMAPQVRQWVADGYAVVQTDYAGLGTPGVHPYLIGRSEGRSVLDIVRAARQLEPSLSRRVLISGHSQGGHAALWAAGIQRSYTPEIRIVGTAAFAPASHLADQIPLVQKLTSPGGGLGGLVSLIIRGVDTAYPAMHVSRLLSPGATALYPHTDQICLGDLSAPASFGGLPLTDVLKPGADLGPLAEVLRQNDPGRLSIKTPVLLLQGAKDTTVFPQFTDLLQKELKKRKANTTLESFDADHGTIVKGKPFAVSRKWLKSRLSGKR